jgi:hypothetical protein
MKNDNLRHRHFDGREWQGMAGNGRVPSLKPGPVFRGVK